MKIKRLDKVCLDKHGKRVPSNLTEYLFGDHNSGYYLLRDSNLKGYVKYDEILKVFRKVLKPLYNSYELLRKQYKELSEVDEVGNIIKYNKKLLKGIPELCLFEIPVGQANLNIEFTPGQQGQNLNNARDAMNRNNNHGLPKAFDNDIESVMDIRQSVDASSLNTEDGQYMSDDKIDEENKRKDTNIDDVFDEFTPFERSSVNKNNVRNKIDLGYSTMNYRTSLIPKVKAIKIK